MDETKSVEPHLFSSHAAHPERRVVIFQTWKELKKDHGPTCWSAVSKKINADHTWKANRSVVMKTVRRCLETHNYRDRPMKRRAQAKVTPRIRSLILTAALKSSVPRHLRSVRALAKKTWCGQKFTHTVVHRILKQAGLRFLRSGTRPYSSAHHDRMRKEFARIGMGLSIEGWFALFFIDETHFETIHRQNRRNVGEWCHAGEQPEADVTVKHPGRVNAAMGICGQKLSPIHFYRGRFNGEVFAEQVGKIYAPAMAEHDAVTTLMMDNDPSHHSRKGVRACEAAGIVKCNAPPPPCWKERCRCEFPEWPWFPAYSPALSPLEIYFNDLQQRVDQLSDSLGTVTQIAALERRVRKAHNATKPEYIRRLYESMVARCVSMYENDGRRCQH